MDFIQGRLDCLDLPGLMLNVLLYGVSHEPGTRPLGGFGEYIEFIQNLFIKPDRNRLCHSQVFL
jgi:hypothetical protein